MADITDNLTLYLPFDESNGSAKAYDYSSGRHDGTVDNATFKQGTVGNCVHFDGNGAVDIPSNMVNFPVILRSRLMYVEIIPRARAIRKCLVG
jgi:hypothetical protein